MRVKTDVFRFLSIGQASRTRPESAIFSECFVVDLFLLTSPWFLLILLTFVTGRDLRFYASFNLLKSYCVKSSRISVRVRMFFVNAWGFDWCVVSPHVDCLASNVSSLSMSSLLNFLCNLFTFRLISFTYGGSVFLSYIADANLLQSLAFIALAYPSESTDCDVNPKFLEYSSSVTPIDLFCLRRLAV